MDKDAFNCRLRLAKRQVLTDDERLGRFERESCACISRCSYLFQLRLSHVQIHLGNIFELSLESFSYFACQIKIKKLCLILTECG